MAINQPLSPWGCRRPTAAAAPDGLRPSTPINAPNTTARRAAVSPRWPPHAVDQLEKAHQPPAVAHPNTRRTPSCSRPLSSMGTISAPHRVGHNVLDGGVKFRKAHARRRKRAPSTVARSLSVSTPQAVHRPAYPSIGLQGGRTSSAAESYTGNSTVSDEQEPTSAAPRQ